MTGCIKYTLEVPSHKFKMRLVIGWCVFLQLYLAAQVQVQSEYIVESNWSFNLAK